MITEQFLRELVMYTGFLAETAEKQPNTFALGKLCNELASHYRALGLSWILLYADIETFGQGLTQSALTRKYFLTQCIVEGNFSEPARKTSYVDPFFDALAVNQSELAKDIARLSPTEWFEDYEYEDDFHYAMFMYEISNRDKMDKMELRKILQRYESVFDGDPDSRFLICEALLTKDQKGFEESFRDLINAYEERNKQIGHPDSDSVLGQNYTFEPNRWIFVEGLALLRISDWMGLSVEEEYQYCPGILRIDSFGAYVSDSFPYIDL